MNIHTIMAALEAAEKSDIPTTKAQAQKVKNALAAELGEFREFFDELGGFLEAVEEASENLAEADGDDREGAFQQLDEDAFTLRDKLKDLLGTGTA